MKKNLLILSAIILVVASSCNRKAFEKKLTGSWSMTKYLYAGKDETVKRRDTTMNAYNLTISEGQTYSEFWQSLAFTPNTVIIVDTVNMTSDTIVVIDTTITPHFNSGRWDLLNSESDLQLKDSSNNVRIYRILKLNSSELDLRNGNEELYLKK